MSDAQNAFEEFQRSLGADSHDLVKDEDGFYLEIWVKEDWFAWQSAWHKAKGE